MRNLTEFTLLERIRKYTLWAVLGSAGITLLISLLRTWDVISYGFDVTAWDRIDSTFSLILGIGVVVLVSLLVASRVKKADAGAEPAAKKAVAKKSTAKPKKK